MSSDPASSKGFTRRDLLIQLGRAGGSAAMYQAMAALGIVVTPAAFAGAPKLPGGSGRGRTVVIIGAGIGGLTAAYELGKAGYECIILEATDHIGGRNRTARRGDVLHEYDSTQTCEFDDEPHLYFNCGPARLPYHHEAVLGYCREFNIALEPFINDNRAAFLHSSKAFGGKPQRAQRVHTDTRGFIAEMLAKAVQRDALDHALSKEDAEKVLEMMRDYGDLDENHKYVGSHRAGFADGDGVLTHGAPTAPSNAAELLGSELWQHVQFPQDWEMAATMMQPVGGMDAIPKAFAQRLPGKILRNAPVTRLTTGDDGVLVEYSDPVSKTTQRIKADYCINNASAYVAIAIENNFSPAYLAALKAVQPGKLFKIAFQARRRFWEDDSQIYGGISWTDQDILQLWYPPHAFHSEKGVMLGCYQWNPKIGEAWAQMKPADRLKAAIAQGEAIHPGYGNMVEKGLSVAWSKVPYMFGCMPRWDDAARKNHYPTLLKPEGNHYMVGDQMSYVSGWQEGAVRSAHVVVEDIARRTAAKAPLAA